MRTLANRSKLLRVGGPNPAWTSGHAGASSPAKKVIVTEINDSGVYGFGQLAMLLRAAYAMPHIQSVCKCDGLAFRVREIVTGVEKAMAEK